MDVPNVGVTTLGMTLSAGVVELIGDEGSVHDAAPEAIRDSIRGRLRRILRLTEDDSSALEVLVALTSVAFLGLPRDFDPRALIRSLPDPVYERMLETLDRMEDGSDGPFVFFQLERAYRKGLHVPGKDWSFQRLNRFLGEARFYMNDVSRSGNPLVTASCPFGEPNFDQYVADLVEDCAAAGGTYRFAASTLPGFAFDEVQDALKQRGLVAYTRWIGTPHGKIRTVIVEVPNESARDGSQEAGGGAGEGDPTIADRCGPGGAGDGST
jgi:hypothetical protein